MIRLAPSLATLALLGVIAALPARADSSFASSASESISTSSAKISDSLSESSGRSENSSNNGHTAQGEYTVTRVAAVDGKPYLLRLHLLPGAQGGGEYDLVLPREAVAQGRVAQDVVIFALQRPYGIAFATADTHEPFFLALQDDWARDLKTTAVTL